MKIGIDLDGVVFDSEVAFRVYEEIFAIEDLEQRKIINYEEPKYQSRYNWTSEEQDRFNKKYLLRASNETGLMAGFLPVYQRLKDLGHKLVVITARGGLVSEMKDSAIKILQEHNVTFDKYYWCIHNKLEICQKEKIDIMIDDDYKIIQQISDAKIKTLYFRDANLKKLEETEYIREVNNWGDIYRYFYEIQKN